MRTPVFARPMTDGELQTVEAGLRSSDAFVLRRGQILLSSTRGKRVPEIARDLGCSDDAVLSAIHAFNDRGLDALKKGSSRPHTIHAAFGAQGIERLRAILHQSPRAFGKPTSLWTLDLLADVCFEQGLTDERVTGETVRATLVRIGIRWRRAKRWISSPDPEYARKKVHGIGC